MIFQGILGVSEKADEQLILLPLFFPAVRYYFAIFGFVCCGAILVAIASILALHIE